MQSVGAWNITVSGNVAERRNKLLCMRHYFVLITSKVFSKNLRNQRTMGYQKNCLQLLYSSTKICDVKTRHKSN